VTIVLVIDCCCNTYWTSILTKFTYCHKILIYADINKVAIKGRNMLQSITTITDELETIIRDDPVRPEIPVAQRVNSNSRIYMLKDGDKTQAVTCVKFLSSIPAAVDDLVDLVGSATTAVFYTIWSYTAGAGRELIIEAQKAIEAEFPGIQTYVTLSPKTDMARRFHLKNGAGVYRENSTTVNYIYK
jgi:hypothetical protein